MRLKDRFGDHGLIAIAIGAVDGDTLEVDTWLMSCRVLKRRVEDEVLNELVRLAAERGCARVRGVYLPTAKNGMVKDHYPNLGFDVASTGAERSEFVLDVAAYEPRPTPIRIVRKRNDSE
jgi:FkbH-like protein